MYSRRCEAKGPDAQAETLLDTLPQFSLKAPAVMRDRAAAVLIKNLGLQRLYSEPSADPILERIASS